MGRKFDKKNATTFNVVHRAHDDALFFDDEAPAHVLVPKVNVRVKATSKDPSKKLPQPNKKILSLAELQQKLGTTDVRDNEGAAAQYGIFYDDSKYDYMQHLKPMGGDGVFVEADESKPKKQVDIEELFLDQVPSKQRRKVNQNLYEAVPEELKGFQPDMDPRIREVLEALDDEAYITGGEDEEDDEVIGGGDIFSSLLQSGEVDEDDDFFYGSDADQFYEDREGYVEKDDDFDEWDLDNYKEEYAKYDSDNERNLPYNKGEEPDAYPELAAVKSDVNNNWQNDFNKFKKDTKHKANEWDSDDEFENDEEEDTLPDLPSIGTGKSKKSKTKLRKKKGALTDTTSFSMTSSALFRTEGLTLLDDRYEQLAKKFEEGDEVEPQPEVFNMSKERVDFEGLLDDFLDNYELEGGGRRLVKKDAERQKIQDAADSVSKSKLSARRKREKEELNLGSLNI